MVLKSEDRDYWREWQLEGLLAAAYDGRVYRKTTLQSTLHVNVDGF
jgi:hypothetical protein